MDSLLNTIQSAFFAILAVFSPVDEAPTFFGYVEGDYLYMAARHDGFIEEMAVRDGDQVTAGALLFTLDKDRERQAVIAAEADLAKAKAALADLQQGDRAEELAIIEARRQQAVANLELARLTFRRTKELVARNTLPQSRQDEDQTALNEARATLRQYQAELAAAKLPARDDQLEQARQAVIAAKAGLAEARTELSDRNQLAPTEARVDRVLLHPGEFAKAGTPVLSLLPPDKVKIRFFLPEPVFSRLQVGDGVTVGCSSCTKRHKAKVTFLASETEYTPPVIFSREERSKLVFMVEAIPEDPTGWHPGQPVDIRLAP